MVLRTVTYENGQLQYEELNLVALKEKRFYFQEAPEVEVEFTIGEAGKPLMVTTYTTSGEYAYEIVESDDPSIDDLRDYQGWYYSDELEITELLSWKGSSCQ